MSYIRQIRYLFVQFLILAPLVCRPQSDSGGQTGQKAENEGTVEVKTESGWIRGKLSRVQDREIVSYLGVRYAKPPIGERRFAAPEGPPEPWDNVRDALEYGADCYNLRDYTFPGFYGSEMWNANTPFSEDCLNLNIFAPHKATNATVMVWIFGGGFFSGSPSLELYNGSVLAAEGDVVVVAINYRMGPLGFLYMGDETANLGLLDQQVALRWIHRNVHLFGGNPHHVTIFGESAGAASVSSHLFAIDSSPLFRYAILQSGGITCPWAAKTPEQARATATKFLELIGCANGTDSERLKCARKVKDTDIQAAYLKFVETSTLMEYQFVPVTEDSTFFRGDVRRLLEAGKFKKTALIIGTNVDEGTFWLPYYLPEYFNNQSDGIIDRNQYWDSVQKAFSYYYFYPPVIRKAIAYQYLWSAEVESKDGDPWKPSRTLYRSAISKIVSDYFFSCQTLDLGDILMKHGSVVYTYYFKERSTANVWPQWMGVMHGYEIEYIFGVPLRKPTLYTPQEVEFTRRMMHYWVSFAKHG